MNNFTSIINSDEFKAIKNNVTPQEFIDTVIPKGYEDLIASSTDGIDIYLNIINKEEGYESQVMITSNLYNTDKVTFPIFLFTNLKTVSFEMNQNQILHLMMISRFEQFKGMTRPYLNLLSRDMKALADYMDYTSYSSYNANIKAKNSKVIIPFKDINFLAKNFIDVFSDSRMEEDTWNAFLLNNKIYPSSIGSMTSSSSVVMGDKIAYRSPAYSVKKDGFTTIFPVSSNIPARLQTHLLGNAISLFNPDTSIIQQDNVIVDGKLVPKDNTYRKAICVFHPMNDETCRLMAGEIEVLSSVADTLVSVTKNIEDNFETLNVEEGKTYELDYKPFLFGVTLMGDEIIIKNAKQITIKSIKMSGINGTQKIYYDLVMKAGNARITSNTGVKGVTKVRNNLGKIVFDYEVEPEGMSNEDLKKRYPALDLRSLKKYKPKSKNLEIYPEMLLGMNSAKAKSNTIVLAGACLAVELGFYVPSEKHGFKGLLNTLDEKEINDAYNSLPSFVYTNEVGEQEQVYVGLVYINYTELGSTYTKVKDIPFAFEAGRYLKQDSNPVAQELYNHIWNTYLEIDKIDAVKELYECYLNCKEGTFNNPRNIPVYNLDKINEIFKDRDLILNQLQEFSTDSKLLDEEFNSQGFFIDLSRFKGSPVIQIPSAKTLKLFSGEMKNGKLIYHANVINVSKIIRGCLKVNGTYSLNTVYSKNKERYTSALAFNSYMNTLKSTVFSGPMDSQHLVQSFIKPKIPGCNLKAVSESWLPDSTVVIMDSNIYKKFKKKSFEGAPEDIVEKQDVLMMYLASNLDTLDKDKLKELFEVFNESCPYSLAIRNPMLWKTQICRVRVWDKETFDLYLKIFHNKSIDSVINTSYNEDVLLTSLDVFIASHGDSDGE